jgi:protein-disulfide isomerase
MNVAKAVLCLGFVCGSPLLLFAESTAKPSVVVATVAGANITRGDLEAEAAEALQDLEEQKQRIVAETLERIVDRRVLELEAKKEGVPVQALLEREVNAKAAAPSEEEIAAFYEENRASLEKPKEQAADQIRQHLVRERKEEARALYLERLRKAHRVQNHLEEEREAAELRRAPALRKIVEHSGAPSFGRADAPVTIVEFSDFQCSFCTRFNPTVRRLRKTYGDDIRLLFRHYPLTRIHPQAAKAAEASLCAHDQGKFWEMHDAMFGGQKQLDVPQLKATAARLGLDAEAFGTCLDSARYAARVKEDLDAGNAAGVKGTPTLFINGRMVPGALPYAVVARVVERELARAEQVRSERMMASCSAHTFRGRP